MHILDVLQSVIGVFVLVAAGYFLCAKKILDEAAGDSFAKIVTMVSIPALLVSIISSEFNVGMLGDAALLLALGLAVQAVTMLAALPLAALLKIPDKRRGVFVCLCAFGNYIFIGLPIVTAVFGDMAAVGSVCFYISNVLIFWTAGLVLIARDAGERPDFKAMLKKIANPPLITFLIMAAVVVLDIKLPAFVLQTAGYLGGLTTPMSMLFTGIIIHQAGIRSMKMEKGILAVLLMRCVFPVAVTLLLGRWMGLAGMDLKNMTLLSAMPVLSATCITIKAVGADTVYAVKGFFWTTAASVVIVPVYAIILLSM